MVKDKFFKVKEVAFNKLSLFGLSIIGCLIGILIIICANYLKKYETTAVMVGQTIISISFSSMLLEWFGYVNYTRRRN